MDDPDDDAYPRRTKPLAKKKKRAFVAPRAVSITFTGAHDGVLPVCVYVDPHGELWAPDGVHVELREAAEVPPDDELAPLEADRDSRIAPGRSFALGQAQAFDGEVALPVSRDASMNWYIRGRVSGDGPGAGTTVWHSQWQRV